VAEVDNSLKGKLILGIDLGTTNSAVAAWDDARGEVVMLPDADGGLLVPSVVGWDRDRREWLVGRQAEALRRERPGQTAFSVKRFMGRWFNDRAVASARRHMPYRIVPGVGGDALGDVLIDFGGDGAERLTLTAPEVSARVLSRLRENAARALVLPPQEVRHAVITVPAYFNVLQRRATIRAGTLAGLEVVDLINAPIAAALAYGDVLSGSGEKRVLVLDLGGGTFDVSLLEVSRDAGGDTFQALVVDGDTSLGGDDIDTAAAAWLVEEARRQGRDLGPDDARARDRLRRAAEQAKVALSSQEQVLVPLTTPDGGDASLSLSRARLEECAAAVRRRVVDSTRRVVEEVACLTWEQVEVVLVGGQTLMPAIRRDVAELAGRLPLVHDRPQLAVALGAGRYARALSQGREKLHEPTLINVIAQSLGIRLDENTFLPLVPANATVPHSSDPFAVTTTEDNQPHIRVEVLQGPPGATRADQCVVLGWPSMDVLPAPRGVPRFEVRFDVQSDRTMRVAVSDSTSDRQRVVDIVETGESRRLTWRSQTADATAE
jgi:molecular chaperone DnaK